MFPYGRDHDHVFTEKSGCISIELLAPLLHNVRIDKERISLFAHGSVRSVLESCSTKVTPSLLQVIKSSGTSLQYDSEAETTIYHYLSLSMERNDLTVIDDNDVVTTRYHDLSLFIKQDDLTNIDDLTRESKLINEATEEVTIDHLTNKVSQWIR